MLKLNVRTGVVENTTRKADFFQSWTKKDAEKVTGEFEVKSASRPDSPMLKEYSEMLRASCDFLYGDEG